MNVIITENNSDKDGYWAEGTVNGRQFKISTIDSYDLKSMAIQNPHLTEDEVKALYAQVDMPKFLNGETYSTAVRRYAIEVERRETSVCIIIVEARSEEEAHSKFTDNIDELLGRGVWEVYDENFDVLEVSEVD